MSTPTTTRTPTLHTLAAALETAAHAEYAADPARFATSPHAWLFTRPTSPAVIVAETALAAAIGPDLRTRAELSARNMRTPDAASGATLAEKLRCAATLAAKHAAAHGAPADAVDALTDRTDTADPRCPCGTWVCDPLSLLRRARTAVYARGITPGHAVARIVLSYSWRTGMTRAAVQGFLPDSCGAPTRGDFLAGGMPERHGHITPGEVAAWLHRPGQQWRIVAGADAADAVTAAGYRVCDHPRHDHPVTPAMLAGGGLWWPSPVADWHVEHGTVSALVVDGAR
jgi:hypothetical protein